MKKIIHVDMDQFFAAVELLDHPELKGLPIAVGHDAERGVVSTASYEARRFGVHSAQSIQVAKRLCPQLIIIEPHFHRYKEVSAQLHDIFHDYTDLIEPISLDEAFLDVTDNKRGIELGVDIAREIKQRIRETTNLTASAGVSYCKFLAKIASDWRKPDGLTVIHPDKALDFIAQLRVEKIWGVGQKTADKMHHMGIFTGADLRQMSLNRLQQEFGKMGQVFYDFARGIDNRPVISECRCHHPSLSHCARTRQPFREKRLRGPHPDAESQVRGLPTDHSQHHRRPHPSYQGRNSSPCQTTDAQCGIPFPSHPPHRPWRLQSERRH